MKKSWLFFQKKHVLLFLAILLICLFSISTILYVLNRNPAFIVFNGLLPLASIFLFKGKYRFYVFCFGITLVKFMSLTNWSYGSFFTWNVALYSVVVFLEILVKRAPLSTSQKRLLTFFSVFLICIFLAELVNVENISLSKFATSLVYWFLVPAMIIDCKSKKDLKTAVIAFSAGLFISNIIPLIFLYFWKSQSVPFLSTYLPSVMDTFSINGGSAFRFTGLLGDPNHNSCCILLASSLLLLSLFKDTSCPPTKKAITATSITILCFQVFAFLGGSKTYLLCLLLLLVIFLVVKFRKSEFFLPALICFFSLLIIVFIVSASNPYLYIYIKRFILIDTRMGLFHSLTTGRTSIYVSYISEMLSDPFHLLFGHGIDVGASTTVFDKHSVIVELFWDFGVLAAFVYSLFIGNILKFKYHKAPIYYFLPILVFLFYGLTLHLVYKEYILVGFVICYLFNKNYQEKQSEAPCLNKNRIENYEVSI